MNQITLVILKFHKLIWLIIVFLLSLFKVSGFILFKTKPGSSTSIIIIINDLMIQRIKNFEL